MPKFNYSSGWRVLTSNLNYHIMIADIMRHIARSKGWDLSTIELLTCPFCSKTYAYYVNLASHLSWLTPCSQILESIKDAAIDVFEVYKRKYIHVTTKSGSKSRRVIIVKYNGEAREFPRLRDAVLYLLEVAPPVVKANGRPSRGEDH